MVPLGSSVFDDVFDDAADDLEEAAAKVLPDEAIGEDVFKAEAANAEAIAAGAKASAGEIAEAKAASTRVEEAEKVLASAKNTVESASEREAREATSLRRAKFAAGIAVVLGAGIFEYLGLFQKRRCLEAWFAKYGPVFRAATPDELRAIVAAQTREGVPTAIDASKEVLKCDDMDPLPGVLGDLAKGASGFMGDVMRQLGSLLPPLPTWVWETLAAAVAVALGAAVWLRLRRTPAISAGS